ncbi:hypothetical protein [Avibacterium sp. 21-594]|nr:hypothetical protein [Avibacterium sp. 21-594]MCW9716164.1 hypothetical protein [Avibacterium sp. 21-594]
MITPSQIIQHIADHYNITLIQNIYRQNSLNMPFSAIPTAANGLLF